MPPDQNTTPNTLIPDSSPTTASESAEMPFEPQNAPADAVTPALVKDGNSGLNKPESTPENGGITAVEPQAEPVSEPIQVPETQTAQIPVNEPLASEPQTFSQPKTSLARELLIKARNAIQFRKRKKLERVMSLFLKQSKITNDEVRQFLHVSDATAERYLNTLEKENRIKQVGKTGKGVSYSRI